MVALCLKCSPKQNIVKGYNNCTSNFVGHLKRKHGEECLNEYKAYIKSKKKKNLSTICTENDVSVTEGKFRQRKNINLLQDEFEENTIKFFTSSMIPLRAVDNPYFIKTFMDLETTNFKPKLISRRTLTRRIQEYYGREIERPGSSVEPLDIGTRLSCPLGLARQRLPVSCPPDQDPSQLPVTRYHLGWRSCSVTFD
ncbi:hypothetical protein ABEB36_000131 [Hypothenemus hampei]|uniref:BED-type domain-containing protein n=1 Tax=Hypothenemus hampei TaxID=57062 RepID=A0ABD1FAU4_HYPHA